MTSAFERWIPRLRAGSQISLMKVLGVNSKVHRLKTGERMRRLDPILGELNVCRVDFVKMDVGSAKRLVSGAPLLMPGSRDTG